MPDVRARAGRSGERATSTRRTSWTVGPPSEVAYSIGARQEDSRAGTVICAQLYSYGGVMTIAVASVVAKASPVNVLCA